MDFTMTSQAENEFAIRIPLKMMQYTDEGGRTWPISFEWADADGVPSEVGIDRIKSVCALAEQRSGTVGDRYECEIGGETVYIYYTKLAPRKRFKIVPCTEQEYNSYYKLRGEEWG